MSYAFHPEAELEFLEATPNGTMRRAIITSKKLPNGCRGKYGNMGDGIYGRNGMNEIYEKLLFP